MPESKGIGRHRLGGATIKRCPWCGGALVYASAFPVIRLAAGEVRRIEDRDIPALLKTVPAWTCGTRHCRYREPA